MNRFEILYGRLFMRVKGVKTLKADDQSMLNALKALDDLEVVLRILTDSGAMTNKYVVGHVAAGAEVALAELRRAEHAATVKNSEVRQRIRTTMHCALA